MMNYMISKISSKFQVVIPREVRKALQLQEGDQLQWNVMKTGEVRVQKLELHTAIVDFFQIMKEEAEKKGYTEEDLLEELNRIRKERDYVKTRE
ncbi:AbrB/MazE/SpoVT family DNA-binding domain-containing protein [Risungbinella massiliensis]|uniref:AbrB/MazE/SpoVT family DNA-binding domain-containing protein n=1 Tax=Risungbinella massiliensis TaxID=1329796 RepID=UPI00069B3C98|nr:AbrB/MazE/SpoVT family DNA-binding domain-containing protein [Risungbinella massiliensis]